MREKFDFYEYAGIIAPGSALLLGLMVIMPELRTSFGTEGVTFGEFGMFLLVAYVVGHLVQSLGNALEWCWWRVTGGIPSDWVRTGRLLSEQQRAALSVRINQRFGLAVSNVSELPAREWSSITRQVYAAVAAAHRSSRVDMFNGIYGLTRGIAAACIALVGVSIYLGGGWQQFALLGAAAASALHRMHRFSRHYAIELFVQFLGLPPENANDGKPRD